MMRRSDVSTVRPSARLELQRFCCFAVHAWGWAVKASVGRYAAIAQLLIRHWKWTANLACCFTFAQLMHHLGKRVSDIWHWPLQWFLNAHWLFCVMHYLCLQKQNHHWPLFLSSCKIFTYQSTTVCALAEWIVTSYSSIFFCFSGTGSQWQQAK